MDFLSDLFFRGGGLVRLQLGFDNPNKAAVLLGSLALVLTVAAFRLKRRGARVAGGVVSALCWGGLLLTFSRGALVAFGVGLLLVLPAIVRRSAGRRIWLVLLMGMTLALAAFACRGRFLSDASVGNRLEIWRAVPQMVADAVLTGWGLGNAGDAYMGWYQPLRSHERYRTLVSSHLTWLVELGLYGRMAYCAGWLLALGIGLWRWRKKGDPLAFALWLSFGIAALFSSVAESPVLWIVPVAVAIPAVVDFVRNFGRRDCQGLLAVALVWGVLLSLGLIWAGKDTGSVRVSPKNDTVFFGKGRPSIWIVRDLSVMGGGAYGRALRLYAQQATNVTCGIAAKLSDVPSDVRRLVLCGTASDVGTERLADFDALKEIRVLSPRSPARWLSATSSVPIRVFCGEFDVRCPSADHSRLQVVDGNGAYLTHWPEQALSGEISGGKAAGAVPLSSEREYDR